MLFFEKVHKSLPKPSPRSKIKPTIFVSRNMLPAAGKFSKGCSCFLPTAVLSRKISQKAKKRKEFRRTFFALPFSNHNILKSDYTLHRHANFTVIPRGKWSQRAAL